MIQFIHRKFLNESIPKQSRGILMKHVGLLTERLLHCYLTVDNADYQQSMRRNHSEPNRYIDSPKQVAIG